jgi:PAS domain S-box-containing protein
MIVSKRTIGNTSIVGAIILVVYAVVAIVATVNLQSVSNDNEIEGIKKNLNAHEQYIHDLFERAFIESRGLRSIVMELRATNSQSRSLVNKMLKSNTLNNSHLLGFWMVWEPDAFDGQDENSINTEGSNEYGRFVPYWHWNGDSIVLENCILYDESDYYQLPKKHHKEYLLEPYLYPVGGTDSLLISIVLPILEDGKFLGVVGADVSLKSLKNLVNKVADIEGGSGYFLSGSGKYVVNPNEKKIGLLSPFSQNISWGATDTIISNDHVLTDTIRFLSTINFDYSDKPWRLILDVPEGTINDNFLSIRSNLLLLSGISALTIFFLIAYNSSQRKIEEKEKLRVQNQLLQSDARLTSHIEGPNPVSIYSVDVNYNYTGFNSVHKREMLEVFNQEVSVGKYMPEMIPKEMSDRLLKNFQRVLTGEQFNVTTLYDEKFYNQSFNPVYDKDSRIIGLTSSISEVTQQIVAEQELEKYRDHLEQLVEERTIELTNQKEFFQKVIDQIPALIFIRNKSGEYVLLNQIAADSFGLPIDDVIGKTVMDTHHDQKEAMGFAREDKEIIKNGNPFVSEYLGTWPDGTKKWLLLSKHRMYIGQEPFILGIHVDVTHLKETQFKLTRTNEELMETLDSLKSTQLMLVESEKMASIGLLTAGLAHEINNPINYVAGNVGAIKRDLNELSALLDSAVLSKAQGEQIAFKKNVQEIKNEMNSLLAGIEEGTTRVIDLIRDLNAFSGQGRSHEKGFVDINTCVESTVNLVRHQPGKQIVFDMKLESLSPVYGNTQQLKQVLLNMLTNSCQSIEKAGSVMIQTLQFENHNAILIVDSGAGILEEHVNRIFEPFFTTKEVGEGTGLGLAISYNIIKDFGGTIQMRKTSSAGTTFEIRLPRVLQT